MFSKNVKILMCVTLSFAVMLCLGGCIAKVEPTYTGDDGSSNSGQNEVSNEEETLLSGKYFAEIEIENYGKIELTLDADNTPITVTNFKKLADEGFYDGLTFHRIIDGFMMQGGCPEGTGFGGSEKAIKGEFLYNGVKNNISHKRGVISMARSGNPNSASSQFFIVQSDSLFLDGQYAAFGYVTSGMEIVDKICKEANPTDDNGSIERKDQPKIKTIKVYN